MSERLRALLLISFLMLLLNDPVFPQTPGIATGAKPEWVVDIPVRGERPPAESVTEGYFHALIEEQIHVGKQSAYHRIVREIVTGAGVQSASEIYIEFLPDYQELTVHQVTVWRDDNPQDRLDQKAFRVLAREDELSRFIYNGTYTAYLILEDIRQGDRIEYSYTISGQNPVFGERFYRDIYLQSSSDIVHVYRSLLVPEGKQLSFRSFNNAPKAAITGNDGLKRYVWEDFQVKGAEYETYQPSWFDNYAHVQVSEYQDWGEVARWAASVNTVQINYGGKFAETVAALRARSKDLDDYVLNAIQLVQNDLRYMGVETGEHSHRAHTPLKVLEQGYGDCKDKSLLLIALLRKADVEAHMALVNTYHQDKIVEFLPSPLAFNHAVVRIQSPNKKLLWVDPTTGFQGGSLETRFFPDYGRALVIKEGTSALEPVSAHGERGMIYCEENYLVPDSSDTVTLEVRTAYTGSQADQMRSMLAYSGNAQMKEKYFDYYARLYPDIISSKPLKVNDLISANRLEITESYRIGSFIRKDSLSGIEYVNFYANLINEQLPSVAANRKHPVSLNYPYDLDYKVRLISGKRWNMPDDFLLNRDAFSFHLYSSKAGDTSALHYQFSILRPFVPAGDAAQLAADIKQLSDDKLGYNLTLGSGSTLGLSWGIVLFSLLVIGLYAWIARLIYHRRTFSGDEEMYFEPSGPVGGWMILPMIGLFITPLVSAGQLLSAGYYNRVLWQGLSVTYPGNELEIRAVLCFEVAANLLLATYAIFCLIAMFKRRDIFPRLIIVFYVVNVVVIVLDHVFAYYSSLSMPVTANDAGDIAKAVITGAIWITYFSISRRVKTTFTVPYPQPQPRPVVPFTLPVPPQTR